jgi:hypothetical protein
MFSRLKGSFSHLNTFHPVGLLHASAEQATLVIDLARTRKDS